MKNWFKDWFSSEQYLDVYSHRNQEDAEKLLSLILSSISIPSNAKILDGACGAGRHSVLLAKKGFNVIGFDLSKTLVDFAVKHAYSNNVYVNYFVSDMRDFCIAEKFDLILNLFTSFGYFESDKENFIFPNSSYNLLKEGGYFVLDYVNKNYIIQNLIPESVRNLNEKIITEKRYLSGNRVVKEIIISLGKRNNKFIESVRMYDLDEIQNNFADIGFAAVKIYGDYEMNRYNAENSERLIIIFQK